MPDPKDPDLPDGAPTPEYEPGRTPQEFPPEPPQDDPGDGRPRDASVSAASPGGDEYSHGT